MELSSVLPFCYKVTAYTGTNLSSHKRIWMDLSGTPTLRVYICPSWWPCRYQNDTKKITSNTKPDKERSWTYLRKQLNTPWLLWPPVIRESRWIMQHSELLCKSASAPGKQIIARLQCNLHFTKTGWTWYIITSQLQGARKTRNSLDRSLWTCMPRLTLHNPLQNKHREHSWHKTDLGKLH